MNLFVDTNVFLRFFVKDNKEMTILVRKIFALAYDGRLRLATSTIVLTEIMYTLKSFYQQDLKNIAKHIDYILTIKNLLLVDKTDFRSAFDLFKRRKQKIADCLIATQVPLNYKLCSFDQDMVKLIGKDRFIDPSEASER